MKSLDARTVSPVVADRSEINALCLRVILVGLVGLALYEIQDLIRFFYVRIVTGDHGQDFYVYYDAASRFLKDPLSLYEPGKAAKVSGYIYPPLSIVLFAPFGLVKPETAFVLFQILSAGMLLLSSLLILRLRNSTTAEPVRGLHQSLLFTLLLATAGPTFTNFVNGQVSAIVLAFCLAALYLDRNRYPWTSAAVLAVACWIKIYPALLVVVKLSRKSQRLSALRTIACGVVLPILMLWWVPFELYKRYFTELLPALSARLSTNLDNQSVTAALVRLGLPFDRWFTAVVLEVETWIRVTNIALMLALLAFVWLRRRSEGSDQIFWDLFVLSFVPLIAPLGWGHSFLFSLPLIAYCTVFHEGRLSRAASIVAWLLLVVPGYSQWHFLDGFMNVAKLFYLRYPIAVLAVASVIVFEDCKTRIPDRSKPLKRLALT